MSEVAIAHGAGRAIGLDGDRASIDYCWRQSRRSGLPLLPLHIDLANPSPAQGWRGHERSAMTTRLECDGVLALALTHHLVIGQNLPLPQVIEEIVRMAPSGLIEFVPKGDPMLTEMLAFRRDIFPEYTKDGFRRALLGVAKIVGETQVTNSGRTIFEFQRRVTS